MLQYERGKADPRGQLRRTYEFLGLASADHVPPQLEAHVGKSAPKPEISRELRHELVLALAAEVRDLAVLFPELDVGLWPSFRDVV